jgi:glycosyltransferase involved in cell wall biosynthesis
MSNSFNLLIDVGLIKSGGGAQLALNFLDLLTATTKEQSWVILRPENGPLAKFPFDPSRFHVYVYPESKIARLWFEFTKLKHIVQRHSITHFYTFFGAGLPKTAGVMSIVTTAYGISFYPESNFWRYAPLKTYWKNKLNNILRRGRLKHANKIIVETAIIKNRIAKYIGLAPNDIFVLPPVPSRYLKDEISDRSGSVINFIVVSGCDPHKNLWRLPELADALIRANCPEFIISITASESQFCQQYRLNAQLFEKVKPTFRFLGFIDPREIQTAYKKSHFILSMSDIESFSNNYMEAWKTSLPIIASKRDFAEHICGDSACYIEPHNPQESANIILALVADSERQTRMIAEGRKKFAALGTEQERFAKVMEIIAAAVRHPQ